MGAADLAVAPGTPYEAARPSGLWERVDELVDRASRESDLTAHGLQHLAARRARVLGRPPAPAAVESQRVSAVCSMVAPLVLSRVVAAAGEPVVLMKGPELALRYPDPSARPYRDLDLLVADADRAWKTLLAAGFRQTGDPELYRDIHHLRPLYFPGLPLIVEVHSRPKWVDGLQPPDVSELIGTAVPSALGIPGLLTLEPARHAVAVAAHAWAHVPLSRIVHLVDVAVLAEEVERRELDAVAQAWGIERVWRSTISAVDGLLLGLRRPPSGRIWARHLWQVRERTVLERHVQQWLAPFWMLSPRGAVRASVHQIASELRPEPGESWLQQLRHTSRALGNAFTRLSEHNGPADARHHDEDEGGR